ncbi:nuclear transport factor 2 family protein [Spirillospora sp. NPDC052269]
MRKKLISAVAGVAIVGGVLAPMGTAVASNGSHRNVRAPKGADSAPAGVTTVDSLSRENAKVLQDFYAAFALGDIDAAKRFVTADFIMHVPGKGKNAGEYWGPDGLSTFMKNILAWNGGRFALQVPHVSVNGGDGFTREVIDLNRRFDPDRMWQLRFTMNYKFKAGKLSEAWTIPEDQRYYDAYWTAPAGQSAAPKKASTAPAAGQPQRIDISDATDAKNLAFGKEFYKRFWEGDLEGLRKVIGKDIAITIPGKSDISGTYRGFDGFQKFRAKVMATAGDRYKLDVEAMTADGEGFFAKEFTRMNRSWDGKVEPVTASLYYTVQGGKIVKMEDFPEDPYAWETFFTRPNK